jgi:hypothetical protein
MRKVVLFFAFLPICWSEAKAQLVTLDLGMEAVLIALGFGQEWATLDKISENEEEIKKQQVYITAAAERIRQIDNTITTYWQNTTDIIKQGTKIYYASEIIKDIGTLQGKAIQIAKDYPQYAIVVSSLEVHLYQRALKMATELYNLAVADGEKNMLNSKERTDIINHCLDELRTMRGLSYAVCTRLETAVRAGLLKTYLSQEYDWYNHNKKVAENILDKTLNKIK